MAYEKYTIENKVITNLDVGISAGTTTIILSTWDGAKFPNGTQKTIAELVQYNTVDDLTSNIVKNDRVLVTNRSGDTLTVTRGFGGDTPSNFNAWDFLYATNDVAIIEDVQNEVTRLETDKLNKWGLRTALANAWRMFYSNGSSNETALDFGASGTYLKSNGASSNPEWSNPPLDIDGQTLDNSEPGASDYFAWYKNGVGNVKRVMKATTSILGIVEKATPTETTNWTADKFPDAADIKSVYNYIFPWTNVTYFDSAWFNSTTVTSYVTLKSYTTTKSWTFRVSYIWQTSGFGGSQTRVLIDGQAYLEKYYSTDEWDTISWDIAIWIWKLVEFQWLNEWRSTIVGISNTTIKWDR